MNWPLCDEVLDGDTPALKASVLTAGSAFLKQNLKATFTLPKCRCCSISLPLNGPSNISTSLTVPDSYMKVCNRKPAPARIAWSLVGLVSHNLATSWQCSSGKEVKGYFTWTSTAQTWTLYVVGPGSGQIEDTVMESCESFVPKVVVPVAIVPAAVGNATKGVLGSGSNGTNSTNGTIVIVPGTLIRRRQTYLVP
jgi:hypothetical protein